MIGLAGIALAAFVVAATLIHSPAAAPPLTVHVVMAVGVMPLILGAMIYFTPVLTHSRAPSWPMLLVPSLALVAGAMATAGLARWRDLLPVAAGTAILAVATLAGWMWQRARAMLGSPHPGLYWYLLALLNLLLGLIAILGAMVWPEHWANLRRFHLHVNLLGFVGMTAIGTLRVLVPTVGGYADPDARAQLHHGLYLAALGAPLIAAGAAWWRWMTWPGLALWLIPVLRFALPLIWRRRKFIWAWHRASAPLGFATFGFAFVLLAGALHAAGWWSPAAMIRFFLFAFLFPLVTGAVSYLLPVWIWPARNTPAYESAARALTHGSAARGLLFLSAGGLALAGVAGASWLAVATLALYLLQVARGFVRVFTRFRAPA
jgi:hypothetical protein